MLSTRPHDLLRLKKTFALPSDAPPWAGAALHENPWAVVRRAAADTDHVAVGIRGASRSERYATEVDLADVREVVAPEDLAHVAPRMRRHVKVLSTLQVLRQILDETGLAWGPTGSVGFELATGVPTATPTSDLDLLLRLDAIAALPVLTRLSRTCGYFAVRVDCQVETPGGAIALVELVSDRADLLIRTSDGPRLIPRAVAVS